MARPLWKGSLSFGLVSIPIELHTAVHDHRPKFRMLHAKDKSPVKFQRVCQRDGTPVAWQDLVKGYEYTKGQFVVLSKEDFQAAAVEKTRTVDIIDFVKAEAVDDRFFETPYYLVPAKGGERAYALLREAMRQSGRLGIAKFIMREAQHLAAVEVIEDALVLTVMRFADELVRRIAVRLPCRQERPVSGVGHGEGAGEQSRRRVGPVEVHRSIPRKPDADHPGQGQRQEGHARTDERAAPGRSGRPDGAAAPQPRAGRQGTLRPEVGLAGSGARKSH